MSLLRLFIGVILLVLCVLVFRRQALKLKQRVEYYSSLLYMLNHLISELEFLKRPIVDCVNLEYKSKYFAKTVYSIFFSESGAYFPSFLSEDEIFKLKNLFQSLGKSSSESQKIMLNSNICEFNKIYKELDDQFKKNYSVYIKVGFLMGIAVFVMVA